MIRIESSQWDVENKHFSFLASQYTKNWQLLFDLAKLGDLNKPLTK